VSCSVKLKKQDNKGDWYSVSGEAYWDEFAPLRPDPNLYEWIDTGETYEDSGKPKKRKQLKKGADPSKAMVLDSSGQWGKMPRLMLEKCATMQALRAGWPEQYSNAYGEEEMEQARAVDLTAAEMIAMEQEERRAKAIGMVSDEIPWIDAAGALRFIPAGHFGDNVLEEAMACKDLAAYHGMLIRNKEGMQRFWAKRKDDALQVKAELEEIAAKLPEPAQKDEAMAEAAA
jgi:hypothetical protein